MRFFRHHLFIILLLNALGASGAQIKIGEGSKESGVFISISGDISQSDISVLEDALKTKSSFPMPPIIALNSVGGDWSAAMVMGRLLRKNMVWVTVDDNEQCLSACVLLLIGGPTRVLMPRARIGIHRPYSIATGRLSFEDAQKQYRALEVATRAYLKEMNMPDSLFDAMVRVPSEKLYVLNQKELTEFRLDQNDPALEAVENSRNASNWGLTMQDYLARKERVLQQCSKLLPGRNDSPSQSSLKKQQAYFKCETSIMAKK